MESFKEEFDDIIATINTTSSVIGAEWMMIGGIAVASAGEPRNTKDIDFSIGTTVDRAAEIDSALASNGWSRFDGPGQIKNTGIWLARYKHSDESRKLTVDVFFTMSEWQRIALARRKPVTYLGNKYWVATPEDLIVFKLISNRGKDMGDVDGILDMRMSSLDTPYIDSWADSLGIRSRWVDTLTRYQDRKSF